MSSVSKMALNCVIETRLFFLGFKFKCCLELNIIYILDYKNKNLQDTSQHCE